MEGLEKRSHEAKWLRFRFHSLLFFIALPLLLFNPDARRRGTSSDGDGILDGSSVETFQEVNASKRCGRSEWRGSLFFSGFLVGAVAAPKGKDYYKILGVRRNATQRQIDKAYRRKAKMLHPDVAPGKEKEFMEVAKAHEVLSNPEQRKRFDQFGEEGVTLGEAASNMGPGQFPFEVFQQFFGGGNFGAGFGGGSRRSGNAGQAKFSFGKGPMPDYMKEFGFGDPPSAEEEDIDANLYDKEPFVEELTPDNYKEVINGREHVLLVEAYNPHCGPCRDFKYEYVTAANVLEGAIPFAAVNCRNHPKLSLCRQAKRYPSVFFFGVGSGDTPVLYTGKKKYEDINAWVSQMISAPITELSNSNMEEWLARDGPRPKIIFFSNKKPISAVWAITAFQYKTQMNFGLVYPAKKSLLERYFTEPTEFNGGKGTPHVPFPVWLKINDIDTLDGEWIKVRGLKHKELNQTLSRIAAHSRVVQVQPLHQLTARRMRAGECSERDGQAAWGAARTAYTALKDLATKYRRDPVKLVWVDAEKQPRFARTFGFESGRKKELLVAYRPKRKRFMALDPLETAADVEQFIDRVLSGSNLTEKLGGSTPVLVDLLSRQGGGHDEL